MPNNEKKLITLGNLSTFRDNILENLAPAYDNTTTYNVGDFCSYLGKLWKCTTVVSTAEDFDVAKWTETTQAAEDFEILDLITASGIISTGTAHFNGTLLPDYLIKIITAPQRFVLKSDTYIGVFYYLRDDVNNIYYTATYLFANKIISTRQISINKTTGFWQVTEEQFINLDTKQNTLTWNPDVTGKTTTELGGIKDGNSYYDVLTKNKVVEQLNSLPIASATSSDFVQINNKLYRKKLISNLNNTTWSIAAGWQATYCYGKFSVSYTATSDGTTYDGTVANSRFDIGYSAGGPTGNSVNFKQGSLAQSINNNKAFTITFTDASEESGNLVEWLKLYGTLTTGEITYNYIYEELDPEVEIIEHQTSTPLTDAQVVKAKKGKLAIYSVAGARTFNYYGQHENEIEFRWMNVLTEGGTNVPYKVTHAIWKISLNLNTKLLTNFSKDNDYSIDDKSGNFFGNNIEPTASGTRIAREQNLRKTQDMLADTYNSAATYNIGDYVIYQNELYRCKANIAIAEAWDSTHWTKMQASDTPDSRFGTVTLTSTSDGTFTDEQWAEIEKDFCIIYVDDKPTSTSPKSSVFGTYLKARTANVSNETDFKYYFICAARNFNPNSYTYYYSGACPEVLLVKANKTYTFWENQNWLNHTKILMTNTVTTGYVHSGVIVSGDTVSGDLKSTLDAKAPVYVNNIAYKFSYAQDNSLYYYYSIINNEIKTLIYNRNNTTVTLSSETVDKPVHFIKLDSTTLTEALRSEILSDDYQVILEYNNEYFYEGSKTVENSLVVSKNFYKPSYPSINSGTPGYDRDVYIYSKYIYISMTSLTFSVTNNGLSAILRGKNVSTKEINSKTDSSTNALQGKALIADGSGNVSWENPNLGYQDSAARATGDVLSGITLTTITNKLPITINGITFAYSKIESYTENSTDYNKIYYYSIKDDKVNTFYVDTQDNKIHFKDYSQFEIVEINDSASSGTFTDEQYSKIISDNCIIKSGGTCYYKRDNSRYVSSSIVQGTSMSYGYFSVYAITINGNTKVWTRDPETHAIFGRNTIDNSTSNYAPSLTVVQNYLKEGYKYTTAVDTTITTTLSSSTDLHKYLNAKLPVTINGLYYRYLASNTDTNSQITVKYTALDETVLYLLYYNTSTYELSFSAVNLNSIDYTKQVLTGHAAGTLDATAWANLKTSHYATIANPSLSGLDASKPFVDIKLSINSIDQYVKLTKNTTNKYSGLFFIEESNSTYELTVYYNGTDIKLRCAQVM